MSDQLYKFDIFTYCPNQKRLSVKGAPVKLRGRATALLDALIVAEGRVLPNEELVRAVWGTQIVEESALRVHLSTLRKGLNEAGATNELIVNEAGRGYRLAARIEREAATVPQPSFDIGLVSHLPGRIGPILGRQHTIDGLLTALEANRFITISGPGGMGKTTVALEVCRYLKDMGEKTVIFVDFAPVTNSALVSEVIAGALGLPAAALDIKTTIISALRAMPVTLLLDNCEHVLDHIAPLAELLFAEIPQLSLIATSREPLRVQGEWVHRLEPLAFPDQDEVLNIVTARGYAALELFETRARAICADFALTEANISAVQDICRQLDGMPLAIELAAARIDTHEPETILESLTSRFELLNRGRRTALPRHKTLRATLDWSFNLLDPQSQDVLTRLSVFRTRFSREGALAVATGAGQTTGCAIDAISDLVAKSLLIADRADTGLTYRLLETTREYGLDQMNRRVDSQPAYRHHCLYILSLFDNSQDAWEGHAAREWLDRNSRYINDVRSALVWSAHEGGDRSLGERLLVASAPLWFHLSMPQTFITYAENFIESDDCPLNDANGAELLAAYGHALWHVRGPVPKMAWAFEQSRAIAIKIADKPLEIRAIWGSWAQLILAGAYKESYAVARSFDAEIGAQADLHNRQTSDHMQSLSLHFAGQHDESLRLLEAVMARDNQPVRANHANHAQVDGMAAALALLSRLKYSLGHAQEAMEIARMCATCALEIDHALSICYGLSIGVIPIAIACGEKELARQWIEDVRREADRHGLRHWGVFADGYGLAVDGVGHVPEMSSVMQREMFLVAGVSAEKAGVKSAPWVA
ncbi:MAG: winged helix-turn-helix domain-containing protein [Asticcacaulis sp.]